ncbi:MAG: MOSC N-terminal beta barrel domain-containing protein, partial [Amylibacter sp.]
MKTVTALFRHPIKGHGRQELAHVSLELGQIFPFDRRWAVAHDASNIAAEPQDWTHCLNFSRGAKAPSLMAMTADLDEASGLLTLNHPELPAITFDPDTTEDAACFIAWVQPIMPENRAKSNALVRANGSGMTDQEHPYISINTTASLADLSQKA